MTRIRPFLLLGALALAGCSTVPSPAGPPPPPAAGACPILSSSDWRAWVNAMPGPGARPTLHVTGKVTVPTGGWQFRWTDMVAMRSYPPQILVTLNPVPPAGAATQALVTQEVRGSWPSDERVGSVTIRCRGAVLATISPVETAH